MWWFLLLDELLDKRGAEWWGKFYCDKDRPLPFFINNPNENLVSYLESGIFKPGRVLDIGCGNGRNSLYLAKKNFEVDGIDFSQTSIEWECQGAIESSIDMGMCQALVNFINYIRDPHLELLIL